MTAKNMHIQRLSYSAETIHHCHALCLVIFLIPLFKYFISFLIERVHKICYEKKEGGENQKYISNMKYINQLI